MNSAGQRHVTEPEKQIHVDMQRVRRPTTASSLKRYDTCLTCRELGESSERCKHYDYRDTRPSSSKQTVDNIVRRMRLSTKASAKGTEGCLRYPRSRSFTHHDTTLPLVSGLKRSKNIDTIVARLYSPTKSIPIHGRKSSLVSRPRPISTVPTASQRREINSNAATI